MKNKKIEFSLIIPHWENFSSLEEILITIKKEERSFFQKNELIIVDSSENINFKFCNYFSSPNYKFIHLANQSYPGKSRNLGAKKAMGKYLFFMDSDIIPLFKWKNILNNQTIKQKLKKGNILFLPTKLKTTSHKFKLFFQKYFYHLWNQNSSSHSFLISRENWDKAIPFLEHLPGGEDLFFFSQFPSSTKETLYDFSTIHLKELNFLNFPFLYFFYGRNAAFYFYQKKKNYSATISVKDNFLLKFQRIISNFHEKKNLLAQFYLLIYYLGFWWGKINFLPEKNDKPKLV